MVGGANWSCKASPSRRDLASGHRAVGAYLILAERLMVGKLDRVLINQPVKKTPRRLMSFGVSKLASLVFGSLVFQVLKLAFEVHP